MTVAATAPPVVAGPRADGLGRVAEPLQKSRSSVAAASPSSRQGSSRRGPVSVTDPSPARCLRGGDAKKMQPEGCKAVANPGPFLVNFWSIYGQKWPENGHGKHRLRAGTSEISAASHPKDQLAQIWPKIGPHLAQIRSKCVRDCL